MQKDLSNKFIFIQTYVKFNIFIGDLLCFNIYYSVNILKYLVLFKQVLLNTVKIKFEHFQVLYCSINLF